MERILLLIPRRIEEEIECIGESSHASKSQGDDGGTFGNVVMCSAIAMTSQLTKE